jgi:hypothetical protein
MGSSKLEVVQGSAKGAQGKGFHGVSMEAEQGNYLTGKREIVLLGLSCWIIRYIFHDEYLLGLDMKCSPKGSCVEGFGPQVVVLLRDEYIIRELTSSVVNPLISSY